MSRVPVGRAGQDRACGGDSAAVCGVGDRMRVVVELKLAVIYASNNRRGSCSADGNGTSVVLSVVVTGTAVATGV